ncbi:hypothetical protein [Mycoplasmopsis cynos]|uniref:hypothetical protein n=1 Tax=Mycoplasmopsis cynos TaxID=171284 RepID=UPI00220C1535|nr:hypothetical protein [Mycoplasmopsis cynos]UWV77386.1 hypothetical protein NW070_00065 [Mycoplasmopsis cynos]
MVLARTSGYIESTNRVIDNDKNGKNNFNSLWVRYNEAENKDWNKLNNKWMDYTEPFKRKSEHGMVKIFFSNYLHFILITKIMNH